MNESPNPNVLHLVRTFDLSGRSRMIADLCAGLAPEVDSAVVCLTGRAGLYAAGLNVIELDLPRDTFSLHGMMKLARLAGERQAHVLHSHGRGAAAYASGVRLMHRRMRLVHTIHRADGDPISARALVRDPTLKAMDAIVAVSRAAADEFTANNGVDSSRIDVIHNGVDLARFSPNGRIPEFTNQQLNKSTITLGAIMNFSPDKDFRTLLEAFAILLPTHPEARLQLVGDGPAADEVKQVARALRIDDQVDFMGFRDDVPALLSGFDLLVHATKSEGLGMALLEAMAAGVPVVATRVGGIPEIIADGKTGILVDPGQADALAASVLNILQDGELRGRIITAARREVARRFSRENMCRQYAELYRHLAVQ